MDVVPPEARCELCEAAPITERYYSDDMCWIAECESCAVPMVVWRHHGANPSEADRAAMIDKLRAVVEARGGSLAESYWIDEAMRTIPDHFHVHARPRFRW
ncbi:MAG: hypothetical protein AAFY28_21415 [Actinomycetota bacterium]